MNTDRLPPIGTLLYATDLSNSSAYAFRYALSLATRLNARLHLLHVLEPLSDEARMTVQLFFQDRTQRDEVLNRRRETVEVMLAERQQQFWAGMEAAIGDLSGAKANLGDVEVIEGFPAEVILEHAKKIGAQMVLMGSHRHGIGHTFLGQVAKRVMRRSRIPTLIIPYAEEE